MALVTISSFSIFYVLLANEGRNVNTPESVRQNQTCLGFLKITFIIRIFLICLYSLINIVKAELSHKRRANSSHAIPIQAQSYICTLFCTPYQI